ncbi:hypothetical protein [Streptomyces sp. NPDC048496]|uniref:hypothetical protein n=1 Tax=Streptomyces sp. NPDC048496 TaxID=3365558 RepID=UPI0037233E38
MTIWNRRHNNPSASAPSNSGVINTGSMGNVQNQPGAIGSSQSQANIGADPSTAARWTDALDALDVALTRDRNLIPDYEQCRLLLDMARQQQLTDPDSRGAARSIIGQISARCGGAPGIASLVSSAMTLLATGVD